MSAREEIGRAMAEKIREFDSSKDLKRIAEDVLPDLEKFLESPAEKRLRRIRNGTMVACVGFAVSVGAFFIALISRSTDSLAASGAGLVVFFVGLALIINGYLHTVPKDKKDGVGPAEEFDLSSLGGTTADLKLPDGKPPRPFSVTEGTTMHLGDKQPIRR
jgi:hypothetical protein